MKPDRDQETLNDLQSAPFTTQKHLKQEIGVLDYQFDNVGTPLHFAVTIRQCDEENCVPRRMIGIDAMRIASMMLGRTPVTKPRIAEGIFKRNFKNWTLSVKYMMLLRLPTSATGRDQKTIMAATKAAVAANRAIRSGLEIPIFDQMISAGLGAKVTFESEWDPRFADLSRTMSVDE